MVVIFRGSSGSGKSRLAKLLSSTDFMWEGDPKYNTGKMSPVSTLATEYVKQLWNSFIKKEHRFRKLSADDFFMVDGKYKFEAKLLDTAHGTCLREFSDEVKNPNSVIVVDNTNCTLTEVVPYAALAKAFAHELQVITLLIPHDVAWRRNQHGTPYSKVVQQSLKLQDSIANWPSWYPQQIFPE